MTGEAFSAPAADGQGYGERSPLPALRELASLVWVQQVGRDAAPYVHRRIPNGAVELVCRVGWAPQVTGPLTGPVVEVVEAPAGLEEAGGLRRTIRGRPAGSRSRPTC